MILFSDSIVPNIEGHQIFVKKSQNLDLSDQTILDFQDCIGIRQVVKLFGYTVTRAEPIFSSPLVWSVTFKNPLVMSQMGSFYLSRNLTCGVGLCYLPRPVPWL